MGHSSITLFKIRGLISWSGHTWQTASLFQIHKSKLILSLLFWQLCTQNYISDIGNIYLLLFKHLQSIAIKINTSNVGNKMSCNKLQETVENLHMEMWTFRLSDGNWARQFPLDLFTSTFQWSVSCGFIEPHVDSAGQGSPYKQLRCARKREEERALPPVSDNVGCGETRCWNDHLNLAPD